MIRSIDMSRKDLLKEYVRGVLAEGYDDIVEVIVRTRVKITAKADPTLLDILTDIRGIKNVITVKQIGELTKTDLDGRQFATLMVKFEDDEEYSVADLERDTGQVSGIDIVKIVSYEGRPYQKATPGKPSAPPAAAPRSP